MQKMLQTAWKEVRPAAVPQETWEQLSLWQLRSSPRRAFTRSRNSTMPHGEIWKCAYLISAYGQSSRRFFLLIALFSQSKTNLRSFQNNPSVWKTHKCKSNRRWENNEGFSWNFSWEKFFSQRLAWPPLVAWDTPLQPSADGFSSFVAGITCKLWYGVTRWVMNEPFKYWSVAQIVRILSP